MKPTQRLSVVIPVRNGQHEIADRLAELAGTLKSLGLSTTEILVVDDGSRDDTVGVLESLREQRPTLRILGHPRPRGWEAAGQTGIERATGDWVILAETAAPICQDDLRLAWLITADPSIVAARVSGDNQPISRWLNRRLVHWGGPREAETATEVTSASALHVLCRSHLQRIARSSGAGYRLRPRGYRLARSRESTPSELDFRPGLE